MSNKNFLRRRGEPTTYGTKSTTQSSATLSLFARQWQGFRVSQSRKRTQIGILLLFLILCIYVIWRNAWPNKDASHQHYHHEGRLVVALSTIPSRIHLLQPTLESLMNKQTLPPDAVYLTLPRKKAHTHSLLNYTLPHFIQTYQSTGRLTILSPEYDYGSIMKVLHVLETEKEDTRIVYVDDDWTYDETMLQVLYEKSLQYPNDALCLNGGMLRNYFRQIGHTNLQHNHYPYVFMETSGTPSLLGGKDHAVDIAQGFCGVLVKPRYFDVPALWKLLQQSNVPQGVIKSDDFILSAHLQYRNITRMLVSSGGRTTPPTLTKASSIDKLSLHMYRHAITAAHYLQEYWNVWQNYKFYNPTILTNEEWNAIDCEAGRGEGDCDGHQSILRTLEQKYPPT